MFYNILISSIGGDLCAWYITNTRTALRPPSVSSLTACRQLLILAAAGFYLLFPSRRMAPELKLSLTASRSLGWLTTVPYHRGCGSACLHSPGVALILHEKKSLSCLGAL